MQINSSPMNTNHLREQLHEYIEHADANKLKAMYTILEPSIGQGIVEWTKEDIEELDRREAELESGKVTGVPWEDVKKRVREVLAKINKP